MEVVNVFFRMPFTAMASMMGAMAELARLVGGTTGAATGQEGLGGEQLPFSSPVGQAIPPPVGTQFPLEREERFAMPDTDLNDDMVKVVSWRILFTKPNEECVVADGDEVFSYRTTGDQWGGQIMTGFFLEPNNLAAVANRNPGLARDLQERKNRRYLKFFYEVKSRFPKEDTYYERRQVEALENIAKTMG